MKLSYKIFEYKGVPVYLNIFFFLLLFIGLDMMFSIFLATILHEIGHIYMAKKLGHFVDRAFIGFLGGGVIIDESKLSNKDSIKISIAGPMTNAILSIISLIIFILSKNESIYEFMFIFLLVNLIMTFVNIIPIYPLDGGRIILSILKIYIDKNKSEVINSSISILSCFIFLFIFLFIYYNIVLSIVSILLIILNIDILNRYLKKV
jgi:stage IV sporulation protein FB